jgi:integrase
MTINTYVGAIRSLVSDAFENEYRIPCKKIGLPSPEPVSSKTPWELETISQFFKPMKPMYQALGGSLFQSGQGLNEILCLNYSDILVEFESNTRPLMLTMQRKKTGIKYVTFLGDSALDLLSNYFKTEGKPKPNERIFPIEKETVERYFSRRCIKMLQPKKIKRKEQVSVDTSLKPWGKGNCPMRPHSLRAGFEKLLVKGKCPQVYAEYWMGHSVSRLHDAYIISGMSTEEWRKEYKKYEPFLSFEV